MMHRVAWDRVYTVNSFWDRPRLGVANLSGCPCIYESPFNEANDDYEDFYVVSPIDPDLFRLVLEDWGIWIRWCEAFDRKETSKETHPALPSDRARHDELKNLIGTRLRPDPAICQNLIAEFRNVRLGWNGLEVQWSEPDR
jgi:hypothetical protein